MHRNFSNTLGPGPASTTLITDNSMSRGLADIGSGSLHKGGTSDSGRTDTGTGTAAQRELTSEINDLLGGADDDWDDEEAAGEGRREESGKLHDSHSGMTGITARKTDPEPSDIAQSQSVSGKQQVLELDNMDDNLFGSFSLNGSTRKTARMTATKVTSAHQSTLDRTNTTADSRANDSNAAIRPRKALPQKQATESDDDLFDFLKEEKEESSRIKPKPKFRLKPKSSPQPSSVLETATSNTSPAGDSKTATDDQQEPASEESTKDLQSWDAGDGSKSRKGHAQHSEALTDNALLSKSSSRNTGPDIPTVHEAPDNEGERSKQKSVAAATVKRGSSNETKEAGGNVSSGLDLEEEDDLLSGLGLDDSRHKPKADVLFRKKISSRASASPVQAAPQRVGSESTTKKSDSSGKSTGGSNTEDEASGVFGGYIPSVVSGPRRSGLPTTTAAIAGRRSNTSLEVNSHSTRLGSSPADPEPKKTVLKHQLEVPVAEQLKTLGPSEAKSQHAKKTVRFAETEASTDGHQPEAEGSHNPALATRRVRGEKTEKVETEVENPQVMEPLPSGSEREARQNEPEHKLEPPVFPWQRQKKRGPSTLDSRNSLQRERVTDKHTCSMPIPELREEMEASSNAPSSSEQTTLPNKQRIRERSQRQVEDGAKSPSCPQQTPDTGSVGRERQQLEDQKAEMKALQHQLEVSEQQQQSLKERVKTLEGEKIALEGCPQTRELELTSQLDEFRTKLHRVECERDQLKSSVDSVRTYHTEELVARDKSHSDRIQALEESFQRREEKWKEELEVQSTHQRERLEQLERDKVDSVLALRKKMESLELAKTNDMAQLQETHRSAVADMKREHELDLQRVKELHRQGVEALKATHSHTQRLSELTGLVEEAARGVTGLQHRVEQAHREGLGVTQQNIHTHQQHLKTLEERLNRQSRDMESERELLRSLAGRLEAHLSQQTQAVESERWGIEQERAKLKAEERAFEEKRATSLARLEQDRRELMESKEKFLAEQQKLLLECLNERHALASERTQLTVKQKELSEREKRETQRRQKMEVELEASLAKVSEEQARLADRAASLQQEESRLKAESLRIEREKKAVERDQASLEDQRSQLRQREEEANKLNQSAVALQREGEEMMEATRREQTVVAEQAETVKRQRQELDQRDTQLASERLAFAQECRVLQGSRCSVSDDPHPVLTSTQWLDGSLPPPSPPLHNVSPGLTHSLPLPLRPHPPRPHNGRIQQQKQAQHSERDVSSPALQRSRQFMAWDEKQDELDLQKERVFLDSIRHQNSSLLSDHFNRLHTLSMNS